MRLSLALLLAVPAPLLAQAQPDTLPIEVAKRQIETFNRHDLDGFMALYADDASIAEFPSGKVLTVGKAAIRERYAPVFKGATVPTVRVDPRVVDGVFVVDQERWEGRPGQRNTAVWMYEIRGGLIRKAWTVRFP